MKDAYAEFLKNAEEFIFAENTPEKSDIIFVPGNGYPQMAECAARLFREGMAEWILPSGRYSVVNGKFSGVLEKSDIYNKEYKTGEKRLYAPTLVAVKNGKIESFHEGTVDSQKSGFDVLTKKQEKELNKILTELVKTVSSNSCSSTGC